MTVALEQRVRSSASTVSPPLAHVLTCPPGVVHGSNPYIRLYEQAAARYGILHVGGFEPSRSFIAANADRFDAVHFHWGIENLWRYRGRRAIDLAHSLIGFTRLLRALRRAGKRIVWTVHNHAAHEGATLADLAGYQLLAYHSDLVICHSERIRDEFLRRRFGKAERTVVMSIGNYDGIYPAPANPDETRARFEIPPGRRVLLACGLIRRYKGLHTAIDAVGLLGSEYHLVIAGESFDPQLERELRTDADATGNTTVVARTISDAELADLYELSDCAILPYTKITGSSAILTAASLSRGVIASDLPFFRDTLALEPTAGELFTPSDSQSLAAAIRRYYSLPIGERNRAARSLADRFAWEEVVRPVVDRYRDWSALRTSAPSRPRDFVSETGEK